MPSQLEWNGPTVLADIAQRAANGLHQFDLRLESGAKRELYPGHGKVTGTLQRSIQAFPIEQRGNVLRGGVGTRGVPYAKEIHDRYRYIVVVFERLKGRALDIIAEAVARG